MQTSGAGSTLRIGGPRPKRLPGDRHRGGRVSLDRRAERIYNEHDHAPAGGGTGARPRGRRGAAGARAGGARRIGLIRLLPEAPVQGDTLTVLVSIPDRARASALWDRTPVPTFPVGRVVRALVGTDPDTAAGVHTIHVAVTDEDGAAQHLSRTVRLRAARFAVRRLTLPPKTFGLITPANLAIERQVLGPVLGRRTAVAWWHGPFEAPSTGPM